MSSKDTGTEEACYVCRPKTQGQKPAIIVIQRHRIRRSLLFMSSKDRGVEACTIYVVKDTGVEACTIYVVKDTGVEACMVCNIRKPHIRRIRSPWVSASMRHSCKAQHGAVLYC